MSPLWIVVAVIAIAALAAAIGLVKSVLRLLIAFAVGVLAGGLVYYATGALAPAVAVPDAVIPLVSALAALSVLLRRK